MKIWVLLAAAHAAIITKINIPESVQEIMHSVKSNMVIFQEIIARKSQSNKTELVETQTSLVSFNISLHFKGPKSLLYEFKHLCDPKRSRPEAMFPNFLPTLEPSILAWMKELNIEDLKVHQDFHRAFQLFYNLSDEDIKAIVSWTSFIQTLDVVNLPIALSKLPAYEGIGIRYTKLDASTISTLQSAFLSGKTLSLDSFVVNERFENALDDTRDRIAAFSPAGFRDLFGEYITEHPYRIVAKLKSGRYITPVGIEQEVVVSSSLSLGFHVVALGLRNDGIPIYFLEEVAPMARSKL